MIPGDPKQRSARGIQLGTARSTPDDTAATPDGYSLESGRRARDNALFDQTKAKEPLVRPSILYAVVAAVVIVPFVAGLGGGRYSGPSYDNKSILQEYSEYRKAAGGARDGVQLPSVEEVQADLVNIANLVRNGRKDQARRAWQHIVLGPHRKPVQLKAGDPVDPLYREGIKYLADN